MSSVVVIGGSDHRLCNVTGIPIPRTGIVILGLYCYVKFMGFHHWHECASLLFAQRHCCKNLMVNRCSGTNHGNAIRDFILFEY